MKQSSGEIVLPAGKYEIEGAEFHYGLSEPNEWRVLAEDLSSQAIHSGETTHVTLAAPKLCISVSSGDRVLSPATSGVFHVDTNEPLILEPRVQGSDGVRYSRFSRRLSSDRGEVDATLRIINEQGEQVVSEGLGYT